MHDRHQREIMGILSPVRQPAHPLRWCVSVLCLLGGTGFAMAQPDDPQESADLRVAGATLREWRQRISQLDLNDPAGAALVPGLIEIVQRQDVPWYTRRQAALTLGRMGAPATDAVPVLIGILRQTDPAVDEESALWSIKALGLFGPLAREAAPDLVDVAQGPRATRLMRLSLLDSLSQIGSAHPAAVPFLIEVAAAGLPQSPLDPDSKLTPTEGYRRAAVETLGVIGPAAAAAVPVLIRALDEENDSLRREAATTLGRLGPAAELAVVPLVERLISDTDPAVQDQAAMALGLIASEEAQEILAQILVEGDDAALKMRVLGIWATWGPRAAAWLPQAVTLYQHRDPHVRLAAYHAGWRMGGDVAVIAPLLVAEFRSEDRQIRRQAFLLFQKLGPSGCVVATQLQALAADTREDVRQMARRARESCREIDIGAAP